MLTGPQKAIAAFVVTLLGGIVTACLITFPDNRDVQTWGGLISLLVTVFATTLGVYQVTNQPVRPSD